MSLDVGGQVLSLLLDRVRAGAITEFCGQYFDEGRQVSWHTVNLGFQALTETGSLHLVSSRSPRLENSPRLEDHVNLTVAERTRRVVLTERGLARYGELCERQRAETVVSTPRTP